jgi:hypothetical protein
MNSEEIVEEIVEENPLKLLKKNIENQLYTIYGSSEFYTIKKNENYTNYEMIYISENTLSHFGTFDELSLESIKEHSVVSAFGDVLAKKTVIDPTVRTARELFLNNIFLKNNDNIQKLTFEHIYKDLNKLELIGRNFTVEPYKLNVYNKGSFFKVHKDTPSTKNMIGTIVYSLTSDYEGGHLIINHNGQTIDHKLNKHEFIFMYANCDHEVTEVTEGCRITLTFKVYNEVDNNLILDSVGSSQEDRIDVFIKTLKETGHQCIKEEGPYKKTGFIIPLSNMYPEIKNASRDSYYNFFDINLSEINLLGIDKILFNKLSKAFEPNNINISVHSDIIRDTYPPKFDEYSLPYVVLDISNIKNEEIGTDNIIPEEGGRYCGNDYEIDSCEYWFYFIIVEFVE